MMVTVCTKSYATKFFICTKNKSRTPDEGWIDEVMQDVAQAAKLLKRILYDCAPQ